MKTLRHICLLCFLGTTWTLAQASYTDKGYWIGLRPGYVPSGKTLALSGMYEWRFSNYWSTAVDLTGLNMSGGYTFLVAAQLRLRIPVLKYNKNIYGQIGFGSGSQFPVLMGSVGLECGFSEMLSIFVQYRRYTANFDNLRPFYAVYSIGINVDITPSEVRQSYLFGK